MKRFLKISLIAVLSLSLMGCSSSAKTEDITDQAVITQMDSLVQGNLKTYFDTTITEGITYEYKALKRFIPSPENPKEQVNHANIFQAAYKTKDPVEGQLLGYGGVLTSDNSTVTGLIMNVAPAKDAVVKEFTQDELIAASTAFLKEHAIIGTDEALTFLEVNKKTSSNTVTILNFEGATNLYAVGIDLYTGTPTYFEYVEKPAQQ